MPPETDHSGPAQASDNGQIPQQTGQSPQKIGQPNCPALLELLQRALGALALSSGHELRRDLQAMETRFQHSAYRIAVFGPFNYGKSTLLNAILGEKALPIDLIPTTGSAILVRYGPTLRSHITLANGDRHSADGTDLLQQFARLDDQRCMRDDVISVDVECPHPLLKGGVELLDLPGTNDREAQDELVRDQLLTADLVIQMLDGRKLMTLGEREHLRDWLQERGIETVLFVVNFLNLLEPDDQKQVMNRMRFVAESFRSDLPNGVSNLCRVDALPALRAQLKGDAALLQTSGLPTLLSALETLVQHYGENQATPTAQQRQMDLLGQRVEAELQRHITTLERESKAESEAAAAQRDRERSEIQRKAQGIIAKGFDQDLNHLRDWLSLDHLLTRYEAEAVDALRRFEFKTWEAIALQPDWEALQRNLVDWVLKAQKFAGNSPQAPRLSLDLAYPDEPWIDGISGDPATGTTPPRPRSSRPKRTPGKGTVVAGGIGWALGGPLGAAVVGGTNYVLNQLTQVDSELNSSEAPPSTPSPCPPTDLDSRYRHGAQRYLERLSYAGRASLDGYEREARLIIQQIDQSPASPNTPTQQPNPQQAHHLALLRGILMQLQNERTP